MRLQNDSRMGRLRRGLIVSETRRMTVRVKCDADSGWCAVSTRKDLEEFEQAHDDCDAVVVVDGKVEDLPAS